MDEGPIKFRCRLSFDRETAAANDIVLRATYISKHECIVEGTVGGEAGLRLRIERAKRAKKLGRPGYPRPRAED
jgi:hypothetical protein